LLCSAAIILAACCFHAELTAKAASSGAGAAAAAADAALQHVKTLVSFMETVWLPVWLLADCSRVSR
jgi:hypothetical protein